MKTGLCLIYLKYNFIYIYIYIWPAPTKMLAPSLQVGEVKNGVHTCLSLQSGYE
jgi:hypothetical protein